MISEINIDNFIMNNYPTVPEFIIGKKGVNEKNLSFIRIKNTIQKVRLFESDINKPFEQFNQADFIELFEKSHWTAINTFVSNKSVVKEFAFWYITTIIGIENIPFGHPKVSSVEYIELEDVSSDFRYQREYFKDADDFFSTLEEIFGTVAEDRYVMNMVFFTLMWEGLNRQEIIYLKNEDINIQQSFATISLQDREITVLDKRSIKIIKCAEKSSGYDILQKNGRVRSFEYAPTKMVLRNTSKKNIVKHQAISESSLNKYCLEQTIITGGLPADSKYQGKLLVYRGISDSAAFLRLLNMNIKGKIHSSDIAKAKKTATISGGIMRSFGENFEGWKKYFGY